MLRKATKGKKNMYVQRFSLFPSLRWPKVWQHSLIPVGLNLRGNPLRLYPAKHLPLMNWTYGVYKHTCQNRAWRSNKKNKIVKCRWAVILESCYCVYGKTVANNYHDHVIISKPTYRHINLLAGSTYWHINLYWKVFVM